MAGIVSRVQQTAAQILRLLLEEQVWRLLGIVRAGAPPGHEFYGNQWTAMGMSPAMREGDVADQAGKLKGGRWKLAEGELPEHLKKMTIPPAWREVHVSHDPNADLQVVGVDSKGRTQRVYSERFVERQSEEKFGRVSKLIQQKAQVVRAIDNSLKSDKESERENATVLKLIHHTGIRPGSEADTGAEKQAYGATTLEGRHVHVDGKGAVSLRFVGKKGVDLNIPVEHEGMAKILVERKAAAGDTGKLFKVTDSSLREYTKSVAGHEFKPKDFRTAKGTETALEEVEKDPMPAKTFKEYKKRVMDVAKKVSAKLGNTPAIALQSYIRPDVFNAWKPA